MSKPETKKRVKRVTTIVAIIFLVLAFSLLIFATVSRADPNLTMFGCRFYYVSTGSMEPEIKTGSLIVVKETPINELKLGDVISFISSDPDIKGMVNSHAIYSIGTSEDGQVEFVTKGAANPEPDEYKVYPDDIIGKMIYKSYGIGKFFEILSDRTVSFCVTVLPIAIIVVINLIDLFVIINTPETSSEKKNKGE